MASDVKLSIVIQCHPKRRWWVEEMQKKIPQARLVEDVRSQGVWPTAKRAWKQYDPFATHHIVLQDDVLPCQDFVEGLEAALTACPEVPVCVFSRRKIIHKSVEKGHSWVKLGDGCWGQGTCFPVSLIEPFFRWEWEHIHSFFKWDDARMALFCIYHDMPVWCTVPSLVEHVGHAKSLVGNRTPLPRIATQYIGEDASALGIDWSKGVDECLEEKATSYIKRPYISKYIKKWKD